MSRPRASDGALARVLRSPRQIAAVLLAVWILWWAGSLASGRLLRIGRLWLPVYQHLGLDLQTNFAASRYWLGGGDPYVGESGDELDRKYVYPPLVLALFAWTKFTSFRWAVLIWTGALIAILSAGAITAARTRAALRLPVVPPLLILALALWSTPVLYALERGNCDALVIPLLILAAWAPGKWRDGDVVAGIALALATHIKIYPGVAAVAGLVVLRRWRSLAAFGIATVTVAALTPELTRHFWFRFNGLLAYDPVNLRKGIDVADHSLTAVWDLRLGRTWLGAFPAFAVVGTLYGILTLWVGRAVRPLAARSEIVYAYYLVLTAAATFLPRTTNDYNLIYLPLAAGAVWTGREPLAINLLMAAFFFFAQPLKADVSFYLVLACKAAGVVAVAWALVYHARSAPAVPTTAG